MQNNILKIQEISTLQRVLLNLKGGNKKKKKKKAVISITKSDAMKKPKGKCFKCEQKGHWKQNCPKATKKPVVQT